MFPGHQVVEKIVIVTLILRTHHLLHEIQVQRFPPNCHLLSLSPVSVLLHVLFSLFPSLSRSCRLITCMCVAANPEKNSNTPNVNLCMFTRKVSLCKKSWCQTIRHEGTKAYTMYPGQQKSREGLPAGGLLGCSIWNEHGTHRHGYPNSSLFQGIKQVRYTSAGTVHSHLMTG